MSKLVLSTRTSVNAANQDFDKLTDPAAVAPSAPVHAARLNGLLKTLANAEGAVAEGIKARKALIDALEKVLETNRISLATEEGQLEMLANRREEVDNKKKEVEDSIMRGFASNSPGTPAGPDGSPGSNHTPITPIEPDRPEIEALTPPGYPQDPEQPVPEYSIDGTHKDAQSLTTGQPNNSPSQPAAALDLLSSLATSYNKPPSAAAGIGSAKKRKLNDNAEFPDLGGDAMDGLDADVAEMLRQDSGDGV